jgi:hypothetical protein
MVELLRTHQLRREAALGKKGDCRRRMRENFARLQISCQTQPIRQIFAIDYLSELDLELRKQKSKCAR